MVGGVVSFVAVSGGLCQGGNRDFSPAKVASLLFPSTAAWVLLQDAPSMTTARFAQVRDQLLTSYLSSGIGKCAEAEDHDCSSIRRILWEGDNASFRVMDVDGDGREEIIYSGPAFCREGDMTVVWSGDSDGVSGSARVVEWDVLFLRISPGREVRVSSVAVGCCGDPEDEYYLGTLENVRRYGILKVAKGTLQPKTPMALPIRFENAGETVLRSTPEKKDRYDADLSGLMDHAVFGNILCSYIDGASGEIRAEERDSRGRTWAYVVMDRESNVLRHDAPFRVEVGWVERSTIHEAKRHSHAPRGQ